jgi:hypothetical protein
LTPVSFQLLPDISRGKNNHDQCDDDEQAYLCPQVAGQAVAFVIARHSHGRPPFRTPSPSVASKTVVLPGRKALI